MAAGEVRDLRETPITIVGAGAIGGAVGAFLHDAGYRVTLVDVDAAHVRAINEHGLRITGFRGDRVFPVPAVHRDELRGPLGVTFLCVKGHFTAGAIAGLAPLLAPDGYVLSLQNGLNEAIIARTIGAERTVGAFVHFGCDLIEPGLLRLGSEETIRIGELDGRVTPRAEALRDALGRRICRVAAREAYLVASSQAARLERIGGFDPNAFAPEVPDADADAALDAVADPMRGAEKQHMGIWRDLRVKRRQTEVDMQTAVICATGRERGIPTPVNDAVLATVKGIGAGTVGMGWENFATMALRAGLRT